MSTIPMPTFLDNYLNAVINKHAAIFAGAGLSIPAGFVDYRALIKQLAEDVGLDSYREHDLARIVQYAINQAGGRARVNNTLIDGFARQARPSRNHELKFPENAALTVDVPPGIDTVSITDGPAGPSAT